MSVKVWYDGGCPLCIREIALMRRLDRKGAITFVNLVDADTCPIDRSLMLARLHAEEDGILYSGAAGFAAMWRAIPTLRLLGLVARNKAILWLLEWIYRGMLVVRPSLQRLAGKRS